MTYGATLSLFPLLPAWLFKPVELRIDVDPRKTKPADALMPVHERMRRLVDRLHEIPQITLDDPVLRARFREVDAGTLADLHTRMRLLGDGWTLERFKRDTQMR